MQYAPLFNKLYDVILVNTTKLSTQLTNHITLYFIIRILKKKRWIILSSNVFFFNFSYDKIHCIHCNIFVLSNYIYTVAMQFIIKQLILYFCIYIISTLI